MLKILIPAAEHMQLATTEQIEHLYSCHMTFRLTHLPRHDNMLPVVLQLNVRCRSHSSSHGRVCCVSHSPGLSTSSGVGRIVVEVMLLVLILSGDIETNPGPFGQEDLRNLHCELHPVSYKWYSLGVQLQVPVGILKCIESDYPKVSDRLLEMLTTWLECTNPPPTWEALAKALESPPVGERTLAQQLRDNYCRGGEEVIPHVHPTPGPSLPGAPPTSRGPPSSLVVVPLGTSHPAAMTTPPHQPGPILADLGTLLRSLESIQANWYNFGLQLRVDVDKLDDIATQYFFPLDCLRQTLKHWLKTSSNCTWKCIVNALGSPIVGANALALELERKHCPQLETHAPQIPYSQASSQTFPRGRQAAGYPQPGYSSSHGPPFTSQCTTHTYQGILPTAYSQRIQTLQLSSFHSPSPRPAYTSDSAHEQVQLGHNPGIHTSQPPHIQQRTFNLPSFHPHVGEAPPAAKRPCYTSGALHTVFLNPASTCAAGYTGQPQVTQYVPTCGNHNQPPTPPITTAQSISVPLSHPHQGRSAAVDCHHSHVQPGLAPSYSVTYPSTPQHPTLHNSECYPQLQLPTHVHTPFATPHSSESYSYHPSQQLNPSQVLSVPFGSGPLTSEFSEGPSQPKRVHLNTGCEVFNGPSVQVSTFPAVDMYAKYLKGYYESCGVATEDTKWPPTPTVCFINLAYISKSKITRHEVEEFTRAAALGKIEDIVRVRKPLTFEEVACKLPNSSLPRIVLVEGAPGVGKTTFVWEACRRWANGEILQQYSLVVVLRLRDKRIREANVLSDLFCHSNKALLHSVVQEIENNLGTNLLLILEGLDELPKELREQSSIFLDLMHGRLLPKATILVTTRPWASRYLHEHCSRCIDQHIEILGFTKEQVDCYLESVMGSDSESLADINKYLTRYPQIHAAMRIPLNAAIVVCVYNESRTGKCILPQTMTELYTALTQTLLLRYIREHPTQDENEQLHSFTDFCVPPDVSKNFHKLCKIAYEGIMNGQQLIFSDLPRDFETLGFMQSVPELYVSRGIQVSHNFLHLTIQEYLAAVYVAQLSHKEQLEHIKECGDGLFKVVMRFVAGLSKFSEMPLDSLRALFPMPLNDPSPQYHVKCDYTLSWYHVNWMFETQDPDTINAILGSGNTIRFVGDELMPFDNYCSGYCIAHSHHQWKLHLCEITEEGVEMLTLGGSKLHTSKQNASIVSLLLENITNEAVACLFDTLPLHYRVNLQELIGYDCDAGFLQLLNDRQTLLYSLKVLELTPTLIAVEELRQLCDLLASTSNSLEIIKIRVTDDDHIRENEESYMTVEGTYEYTSVSVDVCISSVDDVTSTVSVLTENSNLGLHITAIRTCMNCDLTCQTAKALHGITTLKILEVYGYDPRFDIIGMEDFLAIAKLMNNNKSLEKVKVRLGYFCCCDDHDNQSYMTIEGTYQQTSVSADVHISSVDDVTSAVSVLTENSNLGLHITAIRMLDSDQVCQIAKALHDTTTLEVLEAFDNVTNPNGIKGVLAIAKLINNDKSLEEVKVRLGDLYFSLKEIYWWCAITVGEFRELCDDLLASTSNSLEIIKIGRSNEDYDDDESCMTIEGRCQHTSVSVDVHITSVNDVTSVVSVLTENPELGLHITALTTYMNSDQACQIAKALHGTTTLKVLSILYFECDTNPIGFKDVLTIAKLINNNKSLEKVEVGLGCLGCSLKNLSYDCWCGITVGEFRELCDDLLAASTFNSLETITIGSDGSDQAHMTIEGTYQHTSVSVDVGISSVDDVSSTVSVLTENSDLGLHLTGIRMRELRDSIDSDLACHLAEALHDTTTLKRLEMSDHPTGTKGAIAIVKLIHSNKSLEEVCVRSCNIDSEGVCHLAQALCENTSLRKLNLSSNPIETKGAMALAKLLHSNKSLEEVYMCFCNISSEEACHFAQALCENTTLRKLNLSYNPIGREGAISLAGMLHANESLQRLVLFATLLGEEGTHKLLEAMTVNSTLQHLILPKECEEYAHKFPKLSEVQSRVFSYEVFGYLF